MKGKTNLYISIGMFIFGIVEWFENKPDEFILYSALGLAFFVTWVSMQDKYAGEMKKLLVVISWILIAFSLFWFLYLVRTDSWR
ncbi:MAG: hypothetical protein OEW75_08705 [Cyclobacteriaceae bacterium]|nr:hypothetical protein [Cyclobacteriaceae bacterium]